jgi:hypothetical protein
MMYQFQTSLLTPARTGKIDLSTHFDFMQAARGFVPMLLFSALGLFTTLYLMSREVPGTVENAPVAAIKANVLPHLVISPASLEPNLNGVLATGDGGAALPLEELIAGVRREAFNNNLVHVKAPTSPTRTR